MSRFGKLVQQFLDYKEGGRDVGKKSTVRDH